MELSKEEIMDIMPHRDPVLFVDEAHNLIPGESVETVWFVDPEHPVFKGHFPGDPVFPGVCTIECMAQASNLILMTQEKYKNLTPLFLGVDGVRFSIKILPGDTVFVKSVLASERPEKAIATMSAEAFVNGEKAAEARITVAMR